MVVYGGENGAGAYAGGDIAERRRGDVCGEGEVGGWAVHAAVVAGVAEHEDECVA